MAEAESCRAACGARSRTGCPRLPNTVSSDARHASGDGETSAISAGSTPRRQEGEHLLADQLERAATPGSLEEPDSAVEGRSSGRRLLEQRALQMRERRVCVLVRPRCELDDPAVGEPRRGRRRCGAAKRRPRVPARRAARRAPRPVLTAPRAATTRPRSDPRSRTRRPARRATRPRSASRRSAARRRWPSRSQSPTRSSSAR